jgi:ElaB/YqjD/DUF883 family membrane-anchored ribosome-binding protein
MDREILAQQWSDVCARLKEKWSQLSEADFRACEEGVERLIDQIQAKTGESRAVIEQFLAKLADEAATAANEFRDRLHSKLHEGASQAADSARHGYEAAQNAVRERPGQSLAVAFGLGVAAGVGVAILLRHRPAEVATRHGFSSDQLGRHLADALARFMHKQ